MTEAANLPHSTPEAQGISSAAIRAFVDAAERKIHHLHSFMLLRHGHVVAEGWWAPYGPQTPHMLYSLSKSFTSTAIGLLVAEGRLTIDAPVLTFFPDQAPPAPSENLRAMRVRHLLTMSTGHAADPFERLVIASSSQVAGGGQATGDWARHFLAQPVVHAPGARFVYNSGATYMLSAIVRRITGMRMLDYLRPRLLEPLGIENPTWETSPQGIDAGGWGLSITTAGIARFGQLYLQRGLWQGARLLPAAWVDEATAFQIANAAPDRDWAQGYGYQFWRCRHGAYRGDGAFGQFCVVMPAQHAVLAITAGAANMQSVLDLAWKHLLPAMAPTPLPEHRARADALAARLSALRLPPQPGKRGAPTAAQVTGRTYTIAPNEDHVDAVAFSFGDDGCDLTIRNDRGVQRIRCGYGEWVCGVAALEGADPWPVAASGAWTDRRTYVAQLWWHQTPFGRTLTCRFKGDRLQIRQSVNVAFGATERPLLEGQMSTEAVGRRDDLPRA